MSTTRQRHLYLEPQYITQSYRPSSPRSLSSQYLLPLLPIHHDHLMMITQRQRTSQPISTIQSYSPSSPRSPSFQHLLSLLPRHHGHLMITQRQRTSQQQHAGRATNTNTSIASYNSAVGRTFVRNILASSHPISTVPHDYQLDGKYAAEVEC